VSDVGVDFKTDPIQEPARVAKLSDVVWFLAAGNPAEAHNDFAAISKRHLESVRDLLALDDGPKITLGVGTVPLAPGRQVSLIHHSVTVCLLDASVHHAIDSALGALGMVISHHARRVHHAGEVSFLHALECGIREVSEGVFTFFWKQRFESPSTGLLGPSSGPEEAVRG
jgi:hypothetical protein